MAGTLSLQAFPDNAARREVESLPAVCPSDGCTWKGTLKEYEVGTSLCWPSLPESDAPPPKQSLQSLRDTCRV